MSAGLQVWNDNSAVQIDGSTTHTVLIRSGSVATSAFAPGIALDPNSFSLCPIPINPGEALAFNSAYGCAHAGKAAGLSYLHVWGPPGATVNYWILGDYVPSGTRVGMEVYNEAGSLIYDTGRLPMRVVGEAFGQGTITGLPAGRSLALVSWQQYCQIDRDKVAAGQFGFGLRQRVTTGFANASTAGSVTISQVMYLQQVVPYQVSPGSPDPFPTWNGTFHNNLDNKYTVIDVTGY